MPSPAFSLEATIVSRLCWPPLAADELELPKGVARELKRFEKQFLHIKAPRKLVWTPRIYLSIQMPEVNTASTGAAQARVDANADIDMTPTELNMASTGAAQARVEADARQGEPRRRVRRSDDRRRRVHAAAGDRPRHFLDTS